MASVLNRSLSQEELEAIAENAKEFASLNGKLDVQYINLTVLSFGP